MNTEMVCYLLSILMKYPLKIYCHIKFLQLNSYSYGQGEIWKYKKYEVLGRNTEDIQSCFHFPKYRCSDGRWRCSWTLGKWDYKILKTTIIWTEKEFTFWNSVCWDSGIRSVEMAQVVEVLLPQVWQPEFHIPRPCKVEGEYTMSSDFHTCVTPQAHTHNN